MKNPRNKALENSKDKPKKSRSFDLVGNIMAYEGGELSDKETKQLFKHLDKKGLTNKLQGHYGRAREGMRKSGFLK